jgi:hypothetical protein
MLRAPANEEHPRKAAIELTNIGDLQLNAGDKGRCHANAASGSSH